MLKKFGMVTVGVTAGLLAASPLASASAGEAHHDGGESSSSGSEQCTNEVGIGGVGTGDNELGVGQILNGNNANGNLNNVASCNKILNNVLNDNLSDNEVSILDFQNEAGPGSNNR